MLSLSAINVEFVVCGLQYPIDFISVLFLVKKLRESVRERERECERERERERE